MEDILPDSILIIGQIEREGMPFIRYSYVAAYYFIIRAYGDNQVRDKGGTDIIKSQNPLIRQHATFFDYKRQLCQTGYKKFINTPIFFIKRNIG